MNQCRLDGGPAERVISLAPSFWLPATHSCHPAYAEVATGGRATARVESVGNLARTCWSHRGCFSDPEREGGITLECVYDQISAPSEFA